MLFVFVCAFCLMIEYLYLITIKFILYWNIFYIFKQKQEVDVIHLFSVMPGLKEALKEYLPTDVIICNINLIGEYMFV